MLAFCYFVLLTALHTIDGFVLRTPLSHRHFSFDCTSEKSPAAGEENPPMVSAELKPFNEEIRAVLGRTPDKLAQNMYAIGATQGSNVFKLVGELENLSEALEKTVADMAIVAQKLKEEREAKRQEKLKKNE